jgi:hypothetical protein
MCPMKHCSAVSEIVGSLVLVAIVTVTLGIIAVAVLSQPAPPDIPAVDVKAFRSPSGNNLTIIHSGGDTLPAGDYRIIVNSVDRTGQFHPSPSTTTFATGTELDYSSGGEIRSVQLIYQGDRVPEGVQLFQKNFS